MNTLSISGSGWGSGISSSPSSDVTHNGSGNPSFRILFYVRILRIIVSSLRHVEKNKVKEYVEDKNISEEDLTPTQITEIINDKKPSGKKRGAPKYDMNHYKVIMPNAI